MANITEMERVLAFITDHPEQHNQRSWTCETGACLGGHAALMNGWRKAHDNNGNVIDGSVIDANGRQDLVEDVAAAIFDIRPLEALILFSPRNDRDSIALMIKDLANDEDLSQRWTLQANEVGLDHYVRTDGT